MVHELHPSDQQTAGVNQVQLENQLVETVDANGTYELRLSWRAVTHSASVTDAPQAEYFS